MRPRCIAVVLTGITLPLAVAFGTPRATRSEASSLATIHGTVTTPWEGKSMPARQVTIYLISAEESVGLTRLEEEWCRAFRRRDMRDDELRAIGERITNNEIALIPHLPHISKTRTDKYGRYRFANVPAGKAYKVVVLQPYEDYDFFQVRTTALLRPAEKVRIDIDEGDPWWEWICKPDAKGQ